MTSRQKVRLALFVGLGLLLFLVLGDVLGWWASERGVVGPTGYVGISHGSHTHYVPNGWTGEPPLGQFPTEPPPPGMTVGPTGQYVPLQP
ncbi:MAG: hypothetical protein R3181_11055 [Rubricoccaceae bacterium]|nr:hypothetical protein [Rubricoccaceae bacterium]